MNFFQRVFAFNRAFDLPTPEYPVYNLDLKKRLIRFKEIILAEVSEVDDIINGMDDESISDDKAMGMLADWLGDMIVYSASEMVRHGIPPEPTLNIIMDSNDSKFGADGKPIVVNGKVVKGPNYWKPEPKIEAMLALQALSYKSGRAPWEEPK